jgi:DNA polymerase III epsilon subunit family exonuclease
MTSAGLLNDVALLDQIVSLLEVNDRVMPITTVGKEIFRFQNPHIGTLRHILNRLLKADPRLVMRPDDHLELLPDEREFQPLGQSEYVVIDIETTGTRPQLDRMTEIAAIRVSPPGQGKGRPFISDEFVTLIDPEREIPPSITRLTGITDEMVAGSPRFSEIADRLVSFIGNRIVVAHNAYFDYNFLNEEISRAYGQRLGNSQLCTLKLSRRLVPDLVNHKLHTVAYSFGIEIEDRHRAGGDARATAKMFIRMLDMLADRGIVTLFDVKEFQKKTARPTKSRSRVA